MRDNFKPVAKYKLVLTSAKKRLDGIVQRTNIANDLFYRFWNEWKAYKTILPQGTKYLIGNNMLENCPKMRDGRPLEEDLVQAQRSVFTASIIGLIQCIMQATLKE